MLEASTSRRGMTGARAISLEQHRRAEVVVADVVADVVEVDAEADHRRLVADRVDAGERRPHGGGIADVAEDVVDVGRVVPQRSQVEDAHFLAAVDELLDDVRADETRRLR